MIKRRLLKTLAIMSVLLALAAAPAIAVTTNGPLVGTLSSTGQINTIDPTTGGLTFIPGAVGDNRLVSAPSVTPDGTTVIYAGRVGDNSELFSVPLDGSATPTQLTPPATEFSLSLKRDPVVSPDGQTVYFNWDRYDSNFNFQRGLYSVPISGGEPTQIVENASSRPGMKITPDGQYLVYLATDPETGEDKKVETVPLNGGPTHTVVDNTQVADFGGFTQLAISPDGKTVVMTGVERKGFGSTSLYTAPLSATATSEAKILPGTTVKPWQNPRTGVSNWLDSPAFSPDGQTIAYTLHSVQPRIGGSIIEEIRSVPAAGGTPTVIVPFGFDGTFLHDTLLWAPQVVTSVVPEVVDTDPDNGATEVVRPIEPKATFNTELDASTVNTQNVKLEVYNAKRQRWVAVTSTPSYDQDTKTITVTPARSLGSQMEYRVSLSTGIKSSTGDVLASPYSWSFTTAP